MSKYLHIASCLMLSLSLGAGLMSCKTSQSSSDANSPYEEKESLDEVDIDSLRKTYYKLLPEDKIELRSVKHSEFNGSYKVSPEGKLKLPVFGEIKAEGLTIEQLLDLLKRKGQSQRMDLQDLRVILLESSGRHVHVFGAVSNSGAQGFQSQSLGALVHQAGLQSDADPSRIIIMRPAGQSGFTLYEVNLEGLSQVSNSEGLIRPRDLIYVPHRQETISPAQLRSLQQKFQSYLPGHIAS